MANREGLLNYVDRIWWMWKPYSYRAWNCLILDARVALEKFFMLLVPLLPVITDPVRLNHVRGVRREELIGITLALQNLQCQTLRRMSGYVTMHEPASRVVGLEGDDNEAASR